MFQPLRQRASLLANRLVYGHRATPYQVLSDFAADMAGQLDLGDALDRMVSLLGGAAGASRVEAWIRVGAELRPGAVWPAGSAPSAAVELNGARELPVLDPEARAVVPVRHGDDLLGAISLSKPREEPLTSTEDSLLQHLASQASLVMRNAQLTAELRATIDELLASRRRLVEAQDAERRKIERNLHDGAQQQLIALAIQLGLLAESADDPDLIRQAIPDLKAQLSTALDDLRALARGIYPPLLAEQGLVMALRAQAARSPVPVALEATRSAGTRRTPRAPSTSARSRRCRTWPSTPAPRPRPSACPASAMSWSSRSPTMAPASRPPPPATVPACRACPTGWPPTAAPWPSAPSPARAPPSPAASRFAQVAAIALIMLSRAARRAGLIPARMPVTAVRAGPSPAPGFSSPSRAGSARPRRRTPPGVPGRARRASSWPG